MTKDNLRIGDIIEDRAGWLGIILPGVCEDGQGLVIIGTDEWIKLSDYNYNMTSGSGIEYDIMCIRRPNKSLQLSPERWEEAPVIWTREETIKLKINGATMEIDEETKVDILKQLGVSHD